MKMEDYEKEEIGLKGGRGRKRRGWWTICDMKAEMEIISGKKCTTRGGWGQRRIVRGQIRTKYKGMNAQKCYS